MSLKSGDLTQRRVKRTNAHIILCTLCTLLHDKIAQFHIDGNIGSKCVRFLAAIKHLCYLHSGILTFGTGKISELLFATVENLMMISKKWSSFGGQRHLSFHCEPQQSICFDIVVEMAIHITFKTNKLMLSRTSGICNF